mgnify:CR=1 FL=1
MLYTKNLMTQVTSTKSYNSAVRQINNYDSQNILYLQKQYESRLARYESLKEARNSLDAAVAKLTNTVNLLDALAGVL